MQKRPVIGLCADLKLIDPHLFHSVGDKYVRAVAEAAQGLPIILPAMRDVVAASEVLDMIDGLVLTGSYSNLHPKHYGGGEPYEGSPGDTARDDANLQLIPAALGRGLPVFGICRGFQEMNVALGGSLHQKVHEIEGYRYHREDDAQPLEVQYGPAHPVRLTPGGLLARLSGREEQTVNSLHGQGVAQLAPGVAVEAVADDGLVEAFTVERAASFALAVQWHPEWQPLANPFYKATWQEFGRACRDYAAAHRGAAPWPVAGTGQ